MKRAAAILATVTLCAAGAWAQRASTGTFTAPHGAAALPQNRPQPPAAPNSALSQQRRQLIMQQRTDRINFEQQYKSAMQSLETSIKGQTPAQQATARASAQQEWRTKRKALLDSQRQARMSLNKSK